MKIHTERQTVRTKGFCDVIDITERVQAVLTASGIREGLASLFVPGSTAALTTIEFESGAIEDLQAAIERLAPQDAAYRHNDRWDDGNGFAHVRAALLGPSLTIPIAGGELLLGTWQQIVLIDFDNRPRHREVILHVLGGEASS